MATFMVIVTAGGGSFGFTLACDWVGILFPGMGLVPVLYYYFGELESGLSILA